jgi:hypothetical protein
MKKKKRFSESSSVPGSVEPYLAGSVSLADMKVKSSVRIGSGELMRILPIRGDFRLMELML